jgi:hypothetical protein
MSGITGSIFGRGWPIFGLLQSNTSFLVRLHLHRASRQTQTDPLVFVIHNGACSGSNSYRAPPSHGYDQPSHSGAHMTSPYPYENGDDLICPVVVAAAEAFQGWADEDAFVEAVACTCTTTVCAWCSCITPSCSMADHLSSVCRDVPRPCPLGCGCVPFDAFMRHLPTSRLPCSEVHVVGVAQDTYCNTAT